MQSNCVDMEYSTNLVFRNYMNVTQYLEAFILRNVLIFFIGGYQKNFVDNFINFMHILC
jgi:chemotaxis methyl-accepting protein methylase